MRPCDISLDKITQGFNHFLVGQTGIQHFWKKATQITIYLNFCGIQVIRDHFKVCLKIHHNFDYYKSNANMLNLSLVLNKLDISISCKSLEM